MKDETSLRAESSRGQGRRAAGALGVCRAKLSAAVAPRLVLGSILIGPDEAADLDIVDTFVDPDDVLPTARARKNSWRSPPRPTPARGERFAVAAGYSYEVGPVGRRILLLKRR